MSSKDQHECALLSSLETILQLRFNDERRERDTHTQPCGCIPSGHDTELEPRWNEVMEVEAKCTCTVRIIGAYVRPVMSDVSSSRGDVRVFQSIKQFVECLRGNLR